MADFIKEAEEWLRLYGYEKYFVGGDDLSVGFVNYSDPFTPAITCYYRIKPVCKLHYDNLKMCVGLHCGELQFKHPLIGKFIHAFSEYIKICESFNPLDS